MLTEALSPDRTRYPLLGVLKQGPWSTVSLVGNAQGQTRIARRLLLPGRSTEVALLEGIAAQTRRLRSLSTPNVVPFDSVVEGDGGTWVLFDNVAGVLLGRYSGLELAVPVACVAYWMASLLDGLSDLHALNPPWVVGHLEPFDVVVNDDRATIIDVGLFEHVFPEISARRLAAHPFVAFMAPERRWAATPAAAADLYSIGALAFWLLTGAAPPVDRSLSEPSLFVALQSARPQAPEELLTMVVDLLQVYPQLRPASAMAARERLRAVQSAMLFEKPPTAPPQVMVLAARNTVAMVQAETPSQVAPPSAPAAPALPTPTRPVPRWPAWMAAGALLLVLAATGWRRTIEPSVALLTVQGQAVGPNQEVSAGASPVLAIGRRAQVWVGLGARFVCADGTDTTLHLLYRQGEVHIVCSGAMTARVDSPDGVLQVNPLSEAWIAPNQVFCALGTASWGSKTMSAGQRLSR